MVPVGDRSLATTQGWDNLLWNKLRDLQTSAKSLMDYQMWNASPAIEQQVLDEFSQRLESYGVPPAVIESFNNSNNTGWFASTSPTPDDSLARMDILAEMTGSVSGTVHEQRDFSIPGAGQKPIFGTQTGDGAVTYTHPTIGPMAFNVNILLDQFDDLGRAIGGTVTATDAENGYMVSFVFLPDGTKQGEVTRNGELVGLLTMTTDADKFENYVDVQTNQSQPISNP
jgi:hypothetical protein